MLPITHLKRKLAKGAVVAALAASALFPGLALANPPPPVPSVPDSLVVKDGSAPYLVGHAVGTQNYTCQLNTTTGVYAWTFVAPAATLYSDLAYKHPIATHYAGPTWQATDGSIVVGSKVASADSPSGSTVAIPWLLLTAKSTTTGPKNGDRLTATTDVQRINTTGGVAPTTGCDAPTVGTASNVPYTADYYFYELPE